jgi:hypothetical protein
VTGFSALAINAWRSSLVNGLIVVMYKLISYTANCRL